MEVLFLLYIAVSGVVIAYSHKQVTKLAKTMFEAVKAIEGNYKLIEKMQESNTKIWNAHLEKNHGYVGKEQEEKE